MATTPRHASPGPATFPAPGVVAGVQRAITTASETSNPVSRARVDALPGSDAGHASWMALGITRDPGQAKPALRAAFVRLLGTRCRPTGEEALTRWPRRADTQAALRLVARPYGPAAPA